MTYLIEHFIVKLMNITLFSSAVNETELVLNILYKSRSGGRAVKWKSLSLVEKEYFRENITIFL